MIIGIQSISNAIPFQSINVANFLIIKYFKKTKLNKMKAIYSIILIFFLFTSKTLGQSQVEYTKQFLGTLNAEELQKIKYAFSDTVRNLWSNLPIGLSPRPGVAYGTLSDKSRLAFHHVLASILSSQGYLKTTSIMYLDDILNTLYQTAFDEGKINKTFLTQMQNLKWAYGNYFISVFGEPQNGTPWGLNFGGHHMALSMTIDGNNISMSPYFIGTDPSEVKSGKYSGLRVLSKEEDYGFLLINSLTADQKAKAIQTGNVPKDILTNPKSSQRISSYYGIEGSQLDKTQLALLELVIQEYVHNFNHEKAHSFYEKIKKSGLKKVYFAWIGSLESNKPHYYIVNGPDFLIEYDNVGFQNDGNHIHAIFREKENDFGQDILKQHYLNEKH